MFVFVVPLDTPEGDLGHREEVFPHLRVCVHARSQQPEPLLSAYKLDRISIEYVGQYLTSRFLQNLSQSNHRNESAQLVLSIFGGGVEAREEGRPGGARLLPQGLVIGSKRPLWWPLDYISRPEYTETPPLERLTHLTDGTRTGHESFNDSRRYVARPSQLIFFFQYRSLINVSENPLGSRPPRHVRYQRLPSLSLRIIYMLTT